MLSFHRKHRHMGALAPGRCMWEDTLFMMHSTPLCLAPRTPSKNPYPLLDLLTHRTPTNPTPPPPPPCWAPRRPSCRRRLSVSDSDTDLSTQSNRTQQGTGVSGWHVTTQGTSVTLTARTSTGTSVSVTVHL
ncbi:E4 protein [human papillomavirus 106]|uniref:E4 protein n=1 Tax=human papillomavirus 106 TaxID=338326 RepID=Q2VJC3_9PAPI|nr:E4 protein [human papillomavirus 106]